MTEESESAVGGTIAPVTNPRRHDWIGGIRRELLAHESVSGCDETHKHCARCPVVKITIHPPKPDFPFRAWQHGNGERWIGDHAPPCRDEPPPREVPIQ